ncbi:MAG: glutamine synthetase [Clostridiales bacterium]|nr:glutamine synthetase [Clostridiales bacterium]
MTLFRIYPDLLYLLPVNTHNTRDLTDILACHPDIRFVSFVGIDLAGNDTDEKIPISNFLDNLHGYLNGHVVQTDGSSVVLPGIATLNDGRVDFEPDKDVVWYVDYNYEHIDPISERPVGTLRIPSFLVHNGEKVCSRSILKRCVDRFSSVIMNILQHNPALCRDLEIKFVDIDRIELIVATELEFWVSSPDEQINTQLLTMSESLKEQYWKRTKGVVRTALEQVVMLLELYGFEPEMAHKEVGGVKAHLTGKGEFHNIMEQLEVDWHYANALQSGDYELIARIFIKEIFRMHGLDVSFSAKPLQGVAGSGEHTHVNAVAFLKDGRKVNLFSPADPQKDFLGVIGWGALMGFMKHYQLINPFISVTTDAFNRLQPGFEAPTHPVVSLGKDIETPSRNRTVLVGLIRNTDSMVQTRFEIRSPNPHSNTYLCLAATYQCMLDGIEYAVQSGRTAQELEAEFCKPYGVEGEYLEKDRLYRSEEDIFINYSADERDRLFGVPPSTVYDSLRTLLRDDYLVPVLCAGKVFSDSLIASYAHAMLDRWQTELAERIIPDNLNSIRMISPLHDVSNEYDQGLWKEIDKLRNQLAKDTADYVSIFKEIRMAIDAKNLRELSRLQQLMSTLQTELLTLYSEYCQNQID